MAVTASEVSGGRVDLGLGAGWFEEEHRRHGFPFPPTEERIAMFAEQLEIVARSFRGESFDFAGRYYTLEGALPLPTPAQPVPIVVGGSALPGTVGPAARFADEYNTFFVTPAEARRRREVVAEACVAAGREPITFSLMTRCIVGDDRASVERRRRAVAEMTGRDPAERADAKLEGTVEEVAARLRQYADAGVERVMLQHLLHADLDMIGTIGRVALLLAPTP
jgi:alkanesulfonate monooxygenase SsuD/methylene tetrahydromethanopterin reductase-like flavin-dependent oxidoreductase (luciferase family)